MNLSSNILKAGLSLTLVLALLAPGAAMALNTSQNSEVIDNAQYLQLDVEALKSDVREMSQRVNAVGNDGYETFVEENKAEIEELDKRFSEYVEVHMAKFAEDMAETTQTSIEEVKKLKAYADEQIQCVSNILREPIETRSNAQYHDDYFEWSSYGLRGEFYTYSMVPKSDVRLFEISAQTAWVVLKDTWSISMGNDTSTIQSLKDQFMCHFYLKLEYEWNIEKGRPNLGLTGVIGKLCNPVY